MFYICKGTTPEFRHGEVSHCCTRWEQHLFELMFCCQVHRPMLQLQGEPVDSKLHIKLHIADKYLQQPERRTEGEKNMLVRAFLLGFKVTSILSPVLTSLRSPASHYPALLCEHNQCTQ